MFFATKSIATPRSYRYRCLGVSNYFKYTELCEIPHRSYFGAVYHYTEHLYSMDEESYWKQFLDSSDSDDDSDDELLLMMVLDDEADGQKNHQIVGGSRKGRLPNKNRQRVLYDRLLF